MDTPALVQSDVIKRCAWVQGYALGLTCTLHLSLEPRLNLPMHSAPWMRVWSDGSRTTCICNSGLLIIIMSEMPVYH